jgi:hypothetical protein
MNTGEHLEIARRNKRLVATHLLGLAEDFPEWVSIACFYSALHFVEAYFAQCGMNFVHHDERNQHVSILLPNISSPYLRLYEFSKSSRYESIMDHPTPDEARGLAETELVEVEEHVLALLH